MPAHTSGTKWMPDHDAALTRLRREGYSSSQIAGELWSLFRIGYSRNAVIGRAHRLGLTDPIVRRSPKQIAKPQRRSHGPIMPNVEPEETNLRCVEIVSRNLALIDLEPNDCRYPYGDGPYTFCGHPKMEGSSYCAPHHHLTLGITRGFSDETRQVLRNRTRRNLGIGLLSLSGIEESA